MRICITLIVCGLILAGCNRDDSPPATSSSQTPISQNERGHAAQISSLSHNPEVVHFKGFGPAIFGDNEESVRMSWGRPLLASTPAVGATCYYLYKTPTPALANSYQTGIKFMLEDGQFVRYDVDDTSVVAPGDIVVGDALDQILSAFNTLTQKTLIEVESHKYIEGAKTVIVSQADLTETSKAAKLIFELDAQDKVIQWRIGITPQVYYVEGCS